MAFVAMVAFAAVLAELTLTPSPASSDIAGSNIQPGHSLRQYAEDYTFLAACKQVLGNLVMGAPFGLLLPVLMARKWRMIRVVTLTAVVMVLVELVQGAVIEGRAFDVDDVILNTSGALIAYLLLGWWIGRRYHALAVPRVPAAKEQRPPQEASPKAAARTAGGTATKTASKPRAGSKPKAKPAKLTKEPVGASASARKPAGEPSSWSERLRIKRSR
ncbi:VanZ family protein [Streptomyces sp. NPDC088725]|uniref:VanZ family protein n=1 Tax=Streptomyces sp. NPDC088725 TaxID=3365873 RepID=UPI0037F46FE8